MAADPAPMHRGQSHSRQIIEMSTAKLFAIRAALQRLLALVFRRALACGLTFDL